MRLQVESQAELASLCKRFREEAGMTQKQLALALGYKGAQVVGNAENPSDAQRYGTRRQILSYFKKSVRQMYIVEDV